MFESQILRVLVYILGFYTLIAAVQQIISTNLFEYSSWVTNAVGDPHLANIIVACAIPIGVFIIFAAFFNRRKILLYALGFSATYQFGAAALNAIDTTLLGTPSVPALFIGFFASVFYSYYRLQPSGLHMQDKIDNSLDGYTIIEEDDTHERSITRD